MFDALPSPPPESPLLLAAVSVAALALAALATPLIRPVALRTGFVDRPGRHKRHGVPMPLLGGVVLIAAVIAVLAATLVVYGSSPVPWTLLGAALVVVLGLVDDHRGLSAGIKLSVQSVAAVILVLGGIRVALPLPLWVNVALTIFWVIGITNAFNLLDNMDGLSSGVGAVAAVTMAALAFAHGQFTTALTAAALAGACAGFLLHNFAPASIYLGDAGSLFLGFLLAVLGIELRFPDNVNRVTWMVPILILGLAIFDTTLVCWSRLRRGLDPLRTPGRDHLSHRLVLLGLKPRDAVLVIYAVAVLFALAAVVVSDAGLPSAYGIGGSVALAALVALAWLERPSLRARIEHARDS